jgi:hypothetical protein
LTGIQPTIFFFDPTIILHTHHHSFFFGFTRLADGLHLLSTDLLPFSTLPAWTLVIAPIAA